MGISKELLQFRTGEPDEVIERMAEMREGQDGREWLNLQPWVDQDEMPKVSLLRHLFSGRGFSVPTGTWVPGYPKAKPEGTTEIGFVHGAGHNAFALLQDAGVEPPDGVRLIQDHTKRGLVFHQADAAAVSLDDTLAWMIETGHILAGDLPTDDRWVAGFLTR